MTDNTDDIVEQLRFLGLHEAADEIERLRALITAWADADDDPADVDGAYHAAWLDLREAVGR